MQVPLWLLLFVTLLWTSVYVLHAIRLTKNDMSEFELRRRSEGGDVAAYEALRRERLLPRLQALRRLAEIVLLVIAISLTIMALGWLPGVLVATVLCLFTDMLSRLSLLRQVASRLYESRQAAVLSAVESWAWLEWFREADAIQRDQAAASREELFHIIELSGSVLTADERLRFAASRTFDLQTVRDVMTPVSVVDTVDVSDALGPLVLDDLHKTGHSRFPVIDGDVHHVVGILYLHDIVNLKSAKRTVREAMDQRVHYIHENQTLEHALGGFLKSHHHLFVVVNDYRETIGVLALEDVVEALLGRPIVDEFDRHEDLRAVAESNPRRNNLPKRKTDI